MMKLFTALITIICISPVFSILTVAVAEEVKPESAVPGAPDVKEESFVYEPGDRRDPFIPLVEVTSREKGEEKEPVGGTLEGYDAWDFKLIAVAGKEQQYYGLLLSPDNKSFTVRVGTVLGLHKGKVEEITFNQVKITEYIKDYMGELRPRKIILELHKEGVE